MPLVDDPVALAAVVATGLAHWGGAAEWRRHTGRAMMRPAEAWSFVAGLAVTAAAVASPIDALADRTLSAHMVQHVLLLSVAGPLLALGAPFPALLWALPPSWRPRALSVRRRLQSHHDRHFPSWVISLLALQAAVMWAWHIPVAYQAAVHNSAIHAAEHLSFLLVSTAAWWSVVTGRRSRRGAAAVAALMGSVPGIVLGSAMVLAPNPWYPLYVHGGNLGAALVDQQVAGVIMWAFGGMATVVVGAGLFKSWLSRAELSEPVVVAPIRPPVRSQPGVAR
ncbi:MAG: cytochrome c oxidase assembly protein [Acidimicrobiales bacterium]